MGGGGVVREALRGWEGVEWWGRRCGDGRGWSGEGGAVLLNL